MAFSSDTVIGVLNTLITDGEMDLARADGCLLARTAVNDAAHWLKRYRHDPRYADAEPRFKREAARLVAFRRAFYQKCG